MRFVVLGGCGFIGSHVVDELKSAGHDVTVVSRSPERSRPPVVGVKYHHFDFRNKNALAATIAGCDAVLHMISSTVPATGDLDPGLDIASNLIPTIALIEQMLAVGVRRLLFLSSGGTVYGPPEAIPISERHPLRPINSYGIVKVAIESYIGLYARSRGLLPLILRPTNPYGERQGHEGTQGLVNTLLRRALSGDPIEIWGDGSIIRDYLHVQDLARLCVKASESNVTGVFNAASGIGTSVREMLQAVTDVTGRKLNVVYRPGRSVDVPISVLDRSAAKRAFDWEPVVDLHAGLAKTWEWHQSRAIIDEPARTTLSGRG
jgi:UDP-glucose 4-epimerase